MKGEHGRVRILQGDVRARLRELRDGSVHCCITSPPYYGLRTYGTEPQVWGGSSACKHTWGLESIRVKGGINRSKSGLTGPMDAEAKVERGNAQKIKTGSFCQNCGAWRGELGGEPSPFLYVEHMVDVFREVRRVLRDDGTLWLNLGDCFAGNGGARTDNEGQIGEGEEGYGKWLKDYGHLKPKDLVGIPWRVAFALQEDGWWLRSDIIWSKKNGMPESVRDRPTRSHEYVFLITKAERYFFDIDAVKESAIRKASGNKERLLDVPTRRNDHRGSSIPWEDNGHGRHPRSVWSIATTPYKDAHFATFPEGLVERCVKAGTSQKGCCKLCGKPWIQRVERTDVERQDFRGSRFDIGKTFTRDRGERTQTGPRYESISRGFFPACSCDGGNVPCTVLDPFVGSGTTLLVAARLGCQGIGIELKSEYVGMARRRLGAWLGQEGLEWFGLPR